MSENTPRLKPCPFCGAPAKLVSSPAKDGYGEDYEIRCTQCSIHTETANEYFARTLDYVKSLKDIIADWNIRKGEPKRCCANCKHYEQVQYESYGECIHDEGWQLDPCQDGCDNWEGVE